MTTVTFAAGGYRYIRAVFQYSGGVAAEPGFEIVRVRFQRPLPLVEGFARAEEMIRASGRPLAAFCACELRSPAPFTEEGFRAFNEIYAGTLRKWGVMTGDANPVARSITPRSDLPPATISCSDARRRDCPNRCWRKIAGGGCASPCSIRRRAR